MIQCGKQERIGCRALCKKEKKEVVVEVCVHVGVWGGGVRGVCVWGGKDSQGAEGLCVVCEDPCPSARGSVYAPSSRVSHLSPQTHSHLSPSVNIHAGKCKVTERTYSVSSVYTGHSAAHCSGHIKANPVEELKKMQTALFETEFKIIKQGIQWSVTSF